MLLTDRDGLARFFFAGVLFIEAHADVDGEQAADRAQSEAGEAGFVRAHRMMSSVKEIEEIQEKSKGSLPLIFGRQT